MPSLSVALRRWPFAGSGRILSRRGDPTVALVRWLEALGEWVTAFDGLPEQIRAALAEETSPLAIARQGFITVTDEFLRAAQRDGGAQPWVRGRELFLGVLAAAWVRGAALADQSSPQALHARMREGWAVPRNHEPTPGRAT